MMKEFRLTNPDDALGYLKASLDSGDREKIIAALKDVIPIYGLPEAAVRALKEYQRKMGWYY